MTNGSSRFLIIDGSNLAHRAYHTNPMSLFSMIQKAIKQVQPEYLAICFDSDEDDWRKTMYDQYKASRKEKDPQLIDFLEVVSASFADSAICTILHSEADDAICTLSIQAYIKKFDTVILSSDRDLWQLVGPRVQQLCYEKYFDERYFVNEVTVCEKMGITPDLIPTWKALCGDSTDNIPGVKGIGKVGALKLIQEYGNLASILKALDAGKITGATARKLTEHRSDALLSMTLGTSSYIALIGAQFSFDNCRSFGDEEFVKVATKVGQWKQKEMPVHV